MLDALDGEVEVVVSVGGVDREADGDAVGVPEVDVGFGVRVGLGECVGCVGRVEAVGLPDDDGEPDDVELG